MKTALFLFLLCSASSGSEKIPLGDTLPIVYCSRYNISIFGIEHFHPFDSKKYGKVHKRLAADCRLSPRQFYTPASATDNELLSVHTPAYLASLRKSRTIATIAEIPPLRFIPNLFLRKDILEPMRLATGGTILGARLALQYGWAINLSGGYHHAKSDEGAGFCFYADVPIALKTLWKNRPDLKVLIVDLDAHQGNGNSSVLSKEPQVAILDMYNAAIFPNDPESSQHVKYRIQLPRRTGTRAYLDSLHKWLPVAIENEKPGLIVYNAGADIFLEDPLGNLSVSEQGIIDRDNYVFDTAIENKIPVLMVLSGGYTRKSSGIIAKSIKAFLSKHRHIHPAP